MYGRGLLLLLAPVFLFNLNLFSQCCSTGSPVGASVYVGVLGKNYLRTAVYYRHSYSDTYFSGTTRNSSSENEALKYASYNFTGMAVGYGVTKKLTVEADLGYFINKTQQYNDFISQLDSVNHGVVKGYGLSNGGLTLKYGAWVRPSQELEFTLGAGFRYPFTTRPQSVDGVQLNRDVQPSTNAFGASGMLFFNKGFSDITLRIFSINRYDYNFEGTDGYRFGNILLNSVFVSKKLFRYCFAIIQVRSEWKTNDRDQGNKVTNSGFVLLTVSPTLSYSVAGKWNITALCDIPVYKQFNGTQMTPKYAFALSITRDFNLGRKATSPAIIKSADQ
jgi:hypothetical protein